MSRLHVYSARISSRDPDGFDVTRQSGGERGAPFAPSWAILRPALDARREAERTVGELAAIAGEITGGRLSNEDLQIGAHLIDRAWSAYVPAYLAEMRASYRAHRPAWDALLARPRVVLVCYCTDAEHCHRAILRSRILSALGAVDCGEVDA